MRFPLVTLVGLIAYMVTLGCSSTPSVTRANEGSAPTVTITVSAAASLQDVLEAIAPQFREVYPKIAVDYNFGSSGALQTQIEQGAPTDVFFSASAKQMEALEQKGLTLPNTRQDLVSNNLVLIAPQNTALKVENLAELKDIPINRFAVGEFRSVPAGQYAEQSFVALGLLVPLKSKFVFGNNVRSVLAAVESGNAELGMVYATDAERSSRVKILATAPEDSHQPIRYPITVLKNTAHPQAARQLIDFLQAAPAQQTFSDFGFTPLSPSD